MPKERPLKVETFSTDGFQTKSITEQNSLHSYLLFDFCSYEKSVRPTTFYFLVRPSWRVQCIPSIDLCIAQTPPRTLAASVLAIRAYLIEKG